MAIDPSRVRGEPLKFDTLLGHGIEYDGESRSSVRAGQVTTTAVASSFVMESGIHYAEFHIDATRSYIGIVRPMPNLDSGRCANNEFNFFKHSLREDFLATRSDERDRGNTHVCCYIPYTGSMSWTDWDSERLMGEDWEGMERCRTGDTVGMLLNLDEGTLAVYKNNRRLGVMKDGLSGSYCWCATGAGNTVITIERCDNPLAVQALI